MIWPPPRNEAFLEQLRGYTTKDGHRINARFDLRKWVTPSIQLGFVLIIGKQVCLDGASVLHGGQLAWASEGKIFIGSHGGVGSFSRRPEDGRACLASALDVPPSV